MTNKKLENCLFSSEIISMSAQSMISISHCNTNGGQNFNEKLSWQILEKNALDI